MKADVVRTPVKTRLIMLSDPLLRVRNRVKRLIHRIPRFIEAPGKSDSETTFYLETVSSINRKQENLENFRQIYNYREILEHVNYNLGRKYLERIYELQEDFDTSIIHKNKVNDSFGNPIFFNYENVGLISPTTLRYVATAIEIEKSIGILPTDIVAEIGVGYGGQAAILERTYSIRDFTFFDLPQVLELSQRYLERISSPISPIMGNLDKTTRDFDLVISNYAFSELSKDLQEEYLMKVIIKSKKGFMIMNSGRTNLTGRSIGKLQLDELLTLIPNSRVKEEEPLTGPDNYVLLWG